MERNKSENIRWFMKTIENQPVSWGILSTANIARKVAGAINLANNAELIAIASRNNEQAFTWAEKHNVPNSYGSYDELISDPSLDAIYIPLPPSMHAEWTIKAAEHGKHVLCEKPLSTTFEEATMMADACRRNGVQLMDGVMWVHHDRTKVMKQYLKTLGEFRRVTTAFTFNWNTVPYDNIRAKPELGGGSLGDLGYYCVRAILWALEEMPTQVFGTARYTNGVDFNLSGILWYEDKRMATLDCGFDTAHRKWFEVAGTQASLVCDDFTVPSSEESTRFWIHGQGNQKHETGSCLQEVNMIECFSDIVQSGSLEPEWVDVAVNTMTICDALKESSKTGAIIKL